MQHRKRADALVAQMTPGDRQAAEFVELTTALFIGTVLGVNGVPPVITCMVGLMLYVDVVPLVYVGWAAWKQRHAGKLAQRRAAA